MHIAHGRVNVGMVHDDLHILERGPVIYCPGPERMTTRTVERNVSDPGKPDSCIPGALDVADRLACLLIFKQVAVRPGLITEP